jgi:hypothetical protein
MSERADALAYKADVPARTKDKVRETKDNLMSAVTGRVQDVKESIAGAKDSVADATPDREQLADQAKRAKGLAETNPLGLAFGAIALGFLAGLVVPTTRIENERLGPVADEFKAKAKDLGQEALEHGKQVAADVAQAAKETAQQSGQEHAAELKDTATEQIGGSTSDDDLSFDPGDRARATNGGSTTSTTSGQSWSDSPTAGQSNIL